MTKDAAGVRATERANETGKPYVVIAAGNGQWMCEREAFADKNYPAGAERVVVHPSPRADAVVSAMRCINDARTLLESIKTCPNREEALDLLHEALQNAKLIARS